MQQVEKKLAPGVNISQELQLSSGSIEPRVITDEKRAKADEKIYNELVRDLFVPENTGAELVAKYGMSTDTEVGRRIHELMVASFGVQMGTNRLTKSQAQQIMLIVLASILYGTYEFGQRIDNQDIKSAVRYLSEDVNDLQTCLGRALLELDSKPESNSEHFYTDYKLAIKISGYISGYTFNRPKQKCLEKFGTFLSTYYKINNKDDGLVSSNDFLKNYGRVLCRHIQPCTWYDSRKSIDDIRYSGAKVREVCNLINAVKGMGNEFVLAPAVNLYAHALKAYSEEVRKFHENHWAYPRGKK